MALGFGIRGNAAVIADRFGSGVVGSECKISSAEVLKLREEIAGRAVQVVFRIMGIDADPRSATPITACLDLLAHLAQGREAARRVCQAPGRDLFFWHDEGGWGLTGEWRRERQHMSVMLSPFDPALEYAFYCAATWTFGGPHTRIGGDRSPRPSPLRFIL